MIFAERVEFITLNIAVFLMRLKFVSIMSDKYYDLALISRYYFEILDIEQINLLIKQRVKSLNYFRRFKALAVFAGLEFLLNCKFNKKSMDTTLRYFDSILTLKYSI